MKVRWVYLSRFLCVGCVVGVGSKDYANSVQVDAEPGLRLYFEEISTGEMAQKRRGNSPTIHDSPYGALRADKMGKTFVVRDNVDPETGVSGGQGNTILFVGPQSDKLRQRFADWLRQQAVKDAVSELETGVGNIARIRAALGIRQR